MTRSGDADTGVVTVRVLLPGAGSAPLAPSSVTERVRTIFSAPAGTGSATWRANVPLPVPPAAREPAARLQTPPAALPGIQTQPAVEDPGTKVVFAGTVACSTRLAAPWLPLLANEYEWTIAPPGATASGAPVIAVRTRSGCATSASVPAPELSSGFGSAPFVPSSATEAASGIKSRPAGADGSTVTANATEPDAPVARPPVVTEQTAPGLLSGAQAHPAVEEPGLKTVLAGTVAVTVTPVAPWVPLLSNEMVNTPVPPGATLPMPATPVSARSGSASSGVVSVLVLSAGLASAPLLPSSVMLPVNVRTGAPAGAVAFAVAVKIAEPPEPAGRFPIASVQTEPARFAGEQAQPPPPAKFAFTGIVASSFTPAASCVPLFW